MDFHPFSFRFGIAHDIETFYAPTLLVTSGAKTHPSGIRTPQRRTALLADPHSYDNLSRSFKFPKKIYRFLWIRRKSLIPSRLTQEMPPTSFGYSIKSTSGEDSTPRIIALRPYDRKDISICPKSAPPGCSAPYYRIKSFPLYRRVASLKRPLINHLEHSYNPAYVGYVTKCLTLIITLATSKKRPIRRAPGFNIRKNRRTSVCHFVKRPAYLS